MDLGRLISNPRRERTAPVPRYTIDHIIAEGSFGTVFHGSLVETHESIAIKRVKVDSRAASRELEIWKELNHGNIVKLIDAFYTSGVRPEEIRLNFVMEFLPETLERIIGHYSREKHAMPIIYVKLYVFQLFRGLGYLHLKGICHRDIKPSNLLVNTSSHRLAICDFGSAKQLFPEDRNVTYICARFYRAPELLFGAGKYTESVDIWSAGCVLAELLLGQPLFCGKTSLDQVVEVIKVLGTPTRSQVEAMNPVLGEFRFPAMKPKPWPIVMRPNTSSLALDLLSKLLVYEPKKRLSAFEAMGHAFFEELKDSGVRLPSGKELPPLFDWSEEEVDAMPTELFRGLTQGGPIYGVENYIHEIDAWASNDDHEANIRTRKNIPLIITGEQGSGKSSVMAHWLDFHQRSHKKDNDFVVVHFARRSPADRFYFYSLHRMFSRLREEFDIKQKMPILEDKLRVYFSRWLELSNAKKESEVKRTRIILIFDGIERYRDVSGKEETPDWIPTESPNGVFLVYVVSQESRSYKILMNKARLTITVGKLSPGIRDQMLSAWLEKMSPEELTAAKTRVEIVRKILALDSLCSNALYTSLFLSLAFAKSMQFPAFPLEHIERCTTSDSLFTAAVDFYCSTDELKKVFACLALTRSGLTEDELKLLTGIQFEQLCDLRSLFDVFISSDLGLYQICVDSFREIIISRMIVNPAAIHLDIADVVESQRFTVRNVQEQVHHLYESGNWMRLKDKLISLEVFCVMLTTDYKLELAMYWQKLESCHFDVVQEYNRSLELFVENNHLGNQDLFVLIVQFCRLFKELTDFETELTPDFKHPHFRGHFELKEINLFEEVESIPGMYSEKQLSAVDEHEQFNIENNISRDQLKASILKMVQEGDPQRSQPKYYYYKRWLWIQFPWGALDVYGNLSQTIGKFNSYHEVVSQEVERELGVITLKIINESAMQRDIALRQVQAQFAQKSTPAEAHLNRSMSNGKGTGFLPKLVLSKADISGIFTPTQSLTEEQFLKTVQPAKFPQKTRAASNLDRDFSFDVMFKELTPENVLVKLGAQVVHYSNQEIDKKVKENYNLQKIFNRLANERKQKQLQLAGLQSQLAKSVDKVREQEEIRQKIHKFQHKIELTYERLNKEELEKKRLEQVVVCCFKNPARNDEWERSLDKHISNIKMYVDLEMKDIEQYELEREQLNTKIKEFESLFKDKIVYQNHTIDRVAEQFMMKANFKETLINGERRRQRVIRLSNLPKKLEYYREQLREQEGKRRNLATIRTALKEKLAECKTVFTRLQESGFITHPRELINIIFQLERNEELKVSQSKLEAKIFELEREKETLQTKLKFFKQKQKDVPQVSTSTLTEQVDSLQLKNATVDKHMTQISSLVKKQSLLLVECTAIIEHIRKMLKLPDDYGVEHCEVTITLLKITDRLLDFERRIQKVLGFSNYDLFKETFPEILSVQQVACSNADNIRVKASSPEAEIPSGSDRSTAERWSISKRSRRKFRLG